MTSPQRRGAGKSRTQNISPPKVPCTAATADGSVDRGVNGIDDAAEEALRLGVA